MDVSLENWQRKERLREVIRGLNKQFQQYGLAYLAVEPNCLGNKPCLCKDEPEYPTVMELGIRDAKRLLKELKNRKGDNNVTC